jgi:hypothetical protein
MSLLITINRFCLATRMSPSKFGRLAVNDPRLVHDLRMGRQPRRKMVERVERFIAEARP